MPTWHKGNAGEDANLYRGWLVGHFVDDTDDVRHSKDVEVKWGIHPAGDERTEWSAGVHDRTILILVSGRWRLDLAVDGQHDNPTTILLDTPGDYVIWDHGVDHHWRAEEASVMITVRWPSLQQDL
jgi:hypothetical protein